MSNNKPIRRIAIIGAPLLSALLIVAGFFLDPAIDASGRELAREYAAHPGREQVSALAFHFAFALLAIPAVALIVAVRGRGAWIANIAAVLNRPATSVDIALDKARSTFSGTLPRSVRIGFGTSVNRFERIACAVAPVNGRSPST